MGVKAVKSDAVTETANNFTRMKSIVVPVYSFKNRTSGFFLTQSAIRMKKSEDEEGKEKVTPLMRIVDLETGEECDMIVPTLLMSELQENYPEDSYAGKKFEVAVSASPKEGKRYKSVQLWEIS